MTPKFVFGKIWNVSFLHIFIRSVCSNGKALKKNPVIKTFEINFGVRRW